MLSSRLSGLCKSGLITQNIRLLSTATGYSKEHFDGMVKSGTKVVVFMKGTPEAPKCGFSNAVVQILKMHGVDKYDAYNVLEDDNLRQGVKDYTNWPTIPQVFIDGELVGGCDIMIELHQKGELINELKKAGIKSALAESKIEKS
jgi:monothiol glutaredoxin